MGRPLVKLLLWVFIVLVQNHGGLLEGCLEEERTGLLKLKAFFTLDNSDETSHLLLPSWVDERESECCDWERVSCNHTTGRVVELNLDDQLRYYKLRYNMSSYPYCLNVSLFKPFEELLSLDISGNDLDCYVENEGFESLLKLERLEILNVAINGFNNSILKSLGLLTSLKTLNVSQNRLEGPLVLQELSTLRKLEKLDLSWNSLNASLSAQDYQTLSKLSKLEHLDLSYNYFNKDILKSLGNFPVLKFLSVKGNQMERPLSNKDYQTLLKLSKLEHLDLSSNYFNKDILKSLGNLPVLKFLSMESNQMEGPLSNKELANLYNLEVLILRQNQLNGTLPIQDLISFKNLKVLDLSNNMFTGNIPPHIGAMTSLKALSLAGNNLNNTFSVQGLCKLRNLQELDLSANTFEGILPPCLSNLRSLRMLDLSENQFKGDITFIISNLTSLEYINLNNFEGLFSFSSLANHSKLEVVEIISDNNKMEVETDHYSNWTPKFQLKALVLSNCNLNKLTREIPKFLLHQYRLRIVDLSHNNLKGVFPYWLLISNARLIILHLRNNSLTGQIDLPPHLNMSTSWMDVSDNHFHGQLQESISRRLPYISYLNLSKNSFEGILPSSLCNMSDLHYLDLSVNMFSGEVPKELVSGCIDLQVLKLSRNKFHGPILSTHFNLSGLSILQLEDNQFSGILSNTISKSFCPQILDISNNYFSGVISSWICNMTCLDTVIMRNNFFKGRLPPCELAPFRLLDVSHNSLSGSLPSFLISNRIEQMYLQANKFAGPIPNAFFNSSSLLILDIRDNSLSGNIPNGISALSSLRVLLLRGNHLNGLIPNQLCKLNKIALMDLSNNSFSGSIPRCITNISFGKIGPSEHAFEQLLYSSWDGLIIDTYGSLLVKELEISSAQLFNLPAQAEFVTKRRSSSYKGDILNFMSGLDLSCNNLTGEIPHELGELAWIHALNLSHNQLKGSIPRTFSSLTQIESLDLSYNKLSGVIPMELVDLYFLAVFSVAHNNLSGKIPDMKAQFGTFDESSYEGNPNLCGPLLEKTCTTIVQSPNSPTTFSEESETKWYEIDPEAFYVTFSVSYIIFLLALASVLAINPYWRRRWFNFIEERIYSSYYFVYDAFYKLLAH